VKNSNEVLKSYLEAGSGKVRMDMLRMLLSSFFAGMFIALGAFGSQVASGCASSAAAGKMLCAVVFPVGLTMVLISGVELFTGNNLLIIAARAKTPSGSYVNFPQLLRSLVIVYIGNFIGSLFVAFLVVYSHMPSLFGGALAKAMVAAAAGKLTLTPVEAVFRGILCNILVCVAVWLSLAAGELSGRIQALFLPTMLFVLCGFEHCVANMYFIPAGLMTASSYGITAPQITGGMQDIVHMLVRNLLPVTVGNLIGGMFIVGMGYCLLFNEKARQD